MRLCTRTYEGYNGSNKYGRAPGIPETTDAQKADPYFEIEPRYWILSEVAERRLSDTVGHHIMIAFRAIGAPWRNQRTARGALLPRIVSTHMLPILAISEADCFEFLAIFNSTIFDFLVRGHSPGGNIAITWMLAQLAAPLPSLDPRITEFAERLSLTSYSVARLFNLEPHRWDPEERYALDVELDGLVAHAYGITEAQYATVLDSFEVMARMQIKQHERYKFKDDCLAAYRRLA